MQPKVFCNNHGFTLSTEQLHNGRYLIHIQDANKQLYKTGERKGKIKIHPAVLEQWTARVYNQLMDKILEHLYA